MCWKVTDLFPLSVAQTRMGSFVFIGGWWMGTTLPSWQFYFLIWKGNFMSECLPECMSMYHGCAVPTKARRGYHILRTCVIGSWVLGIEPGLLKEEPVCWTISPAPSWQFGMRRKHSEGSVSKCIKNGTTVGECFQLIVAGWRKRFQSILCVLKFRTSESCSSYLGGRDISG